MSTGQLLGTVVDAPVVGYDWWFRQVQKTVLVPQLCRSSTCGSIRYEHAATSSSSFQRKRLSWLYAHLRAFFGLRPFGVWQSRLSTDFLGSSSVVEGSWGGQRRRPEVATATAVSNSNGSREGKGKEKERKSPEKTENRQRK